MIPVDATVDARATKLDARSWSFFLASPKVESNFCFEWRRVPFALSTRRVAARQSDIFSDVIVQYSYVDVLVVNTRTHISYTVPRAVT